jgi:hypothetical protein
MTDRNFERALRTAARRGRAPGVCPDAGMLAAYADRGLSQTERTVLEAHIADCPTCMEQLALIAAIDVPEEATLQTPAFDFGRLVRRWGWLVPAATVVLVVAVWMRTPPRETSEAPVPDADQRAPVARDKELLDGNAVPPASSVAGGTVHPPASDAESDRVSRRLEAAEKALPATPVPQAEAFAAKVAPAPAPMVALKGDMTGNEAERAQSAARPPAAASDARQDSAAAASGSGVSGGTRVAEPAAMRKAARMSAPMAQTTRVLVRATLGRIDRSTDEGRTWTTELSGVADRIQATACPSADACWLGADNGAVFVRTAAGTWLRRVVPPPASPIRRIVALDHNRATVELSDGRRYVTTDGGSTWTDAPHEP